MWTPIVSTAKASYWEDLPSTRLVLIAMRHSTYQIISRFIGLMKVWAGPEADLSGKFLQSLPVCDESMTNLNCIIARARRLVFVETSNLKSPGFWPERSGPLPLTVDGWDTFSMMIVSHEDSPHFAHLEIRFKKQKPLQGRNACCADSDMSDSESAEGEADASEGAEGGAPGIPDEEGGLDRLAKDGGDSGRSGSLEPEPAAQKDLAAQAVASGNKVQGIAGAVELALAHEICPSAEDTLMTSDSEDDDVTNQGAFYLDSSDSALDEDEKTVRRYAGYPTV